MSVSLVAREVGISSSQLFSWKRLYLEGGLSAVGSNESVVAASELKDALNRIKQLERAPIAQDGRTIPCQLRFSVRMKQKGHLDDEIVRNPYGSCGK